MLEQSERDGERERDALMPRLKDLWSESDCRALSDLCTGATANYISLLPIVAISCSVTLMCLLVWHINITDETQGGNLGVELMTFHPLMCEQTANRGRGR